MITITKKEEKVTPKYRFRIDIDGQKEDIKYLKEQRDKLQGLLEKVKKSKEELEKAKMSGKTYVQSVVGCEFFVKKIETRIASLDNLISLIEENCHKYEYVYYSTMKAIGGQNESI